MSFLENETKERYKSLNLPLDISLEVLLIPKYILIQTKNVRKYYDKLYQWFENAKEQRK